MTIKELRTKADAKLVEFWDLLLPNQEAYLLKHNKCFQLLVTDPVVDGSGIVWEIRKPNDEKRAIDVNFEFNSPVPFQISVDEWVGADIGFSVTATVELPDGRRYSRSRAAVSTIVQATYEVVTNVEDMPVEITPKTVTSWDIQTTAWSEVINQEI